MYIYIYWSYLFGQKPQLVYWSNLWSSPASSFLREVADLPSLDLSNAELVRHLVLKKQGEVDGVPVTEMHMVLRLSQLVGLLDESRLRLREAFPLIADFRIRGAVPHPEHLGLVDLGSLDEPEVLWQNSFCLGVILNRRDLFASWAL